MNSNMKEKRQMHVLGISGSNRKGNTQFMVRLCLDEFLKKGHQTSFLNLKEKNIEYCNSQDYACRQTQGCSCCRDDMKEIYKDLEKSYLIIFGCPTYFSNVSARMKTFMERCNPYWWNKKLKGKKAIILGVGGSSEKTIKQMIQRLVPFIEILGMQIINRYFVREQQADGVQKNQHAILELKAMVQKIQ